LQCVAPRRSLNPVFTQHILVLRPAGGKAVQTGSPAGLSHRGRDTRQNPSVGFALRASLRLSKFAPGDFVFASPKTSLSGTNWVARRALEEFGAGWPRNSSIQKKGGPEAAYLRRCAILFRLQALGNPSVDYPFAGSKVRRTFDTIRLTLRFSLSPGVGRRSVPVPLPPRGFVRNASCIASKALGLPSVANPLSGSASPFPRPFRLFPSASCDARRGLRAAIIELSSGSHALRGNRLIYPDRCASFVGTS
jgi:hypothetical protein